MSQKDCKQNKDRYLQLELETDVNHVYSSKNFPDKAAVLFYFPGLDGYEWQKFEHE